MTGEIESKPEESRERGETREGRESSEQQRLDDATLDPGALIEQSGEFRQAEDVQEGLTSLVENAGSEVPPIVLPGLQDVGATVVSSPKTRDESVPGSLPGEEGGAGGAAAGDDSETGSGSARGAATGDASAAAGLGSAGGAATGDVRGAGTGSAGGAAAGDASGAGTGSAGGAAAGDASGTGTSPDDSALPGGETTEAGETGDTGSTKNEAPGEGVKEWIPPELYAYIGTDGKVIVVDAKGKPVDSPPQLTLDAVPEYGTEDGPSYHGFYPGNVYDSGKFITFSIPMYHPPMENLYLYEDSSGTLKLVDASGKPVDSPPNVVSYQERYYATDPSIKQTIDNAGTFKNPENLVALQWYHPSMDGLFLYEDQDGKVTIVDETGKPVNSPPSVVSHDGKYYASDPSDKPAIDSTGAIKNPDNMIALQWYKPTMEGVYFYEGQDGKITVVDGAGKPVDSPPSVFSYDGKYYATNPGDKPAIDSKGVIKNPANMVELAYYKPSMDDVFLYQDQDGKITVVDGAGKLVDSPPSVFAYEGKYYATNPGDKPAIDSTGAVKNPANMVELAYYKPSMEGVYFYEGQDGKITVVDGAGKPVDSPPSVIKYEGKYYVTNPGDKPAIDTKGAIKNPDNMVVLQWYKPPSSAPRGWPPV